MHPDTPSPNSLLPSDCPGSLVWPQALQAVTLQRSPRGNPLGTVQAHSKEGGFLIQIVLFKSFTKTAVINRAGGLCIKLPLGKL